MTMIDLKDLAKVDLNLLISLQVLLEEASVSRAAERLHITQPAMSKTLGRLRHVFDDALFTRSSHGMQATPRALELSDGLAAILGDIGVLLAGGHFDPASHQGEVTLALSEYIGVTLLPSLMERLNRQAPGLSIKVITRVENQLDELAQGNLDLAIHIKQAHYSREYRVRDLGGSLPAILMREGHPLSEAELTWQRLAEHPMIRLYVSDWEQLEIQRQSSMMARLMAYDRGTLEISHLLTALEVVRSTNYYMPAPGYILQNEQATQGVVGLPVPDDEKLLINYALVAHQRTHKSPLHNWLWEEITCTIAELRPTAELKVRQRITADQAGTRSS